MRKILLTTPDYIPKMGGLTSHTLNVEKVLRELNLPYEVFHWRNYSEVVNFSKEKLKEFDYVLNIHSGFHRYMPKVDVRVINFVNGSEVLSYSPNVFKRLAKSLLQKRNLRKIQTAQYNIFISNFTFEKTKSLGFRENFSRDLIFHMAIDVAGHSLQKKNWKDPLKFICVARDVPHKNFSGAILFCETVSEVLRRPVELVTVTNKKFESQKIKITSYLNPDNTLRDRLLAEAHLNLLFSLDHSKTGNFEGFGQIVQEAGCLGTPSVVLATGGLPESVHHDKTGWVLPSLNPEVIKDWCAEMSDVAYEKVSEQCYLHTLQSHGLDQWARLFKVLLT